MSHNSTRSRKSMVSILALTFICVLVVVAEAAPTGIGPIDSRSVVLPVGRSMMMHFQRMKRVEVIDPSLVEVVVASINDLSICGKKAGTTTVYVWDSVGLYQIEATVTDTSEADRAIANLRPLLGHKLTYTVAGERTIVIEGVLSATELARARSILAAAKENVQIVDLLRAEGEPGTGALAAAAALRQVLGDKLQYVVWNDTTLVVQGQVGDQAEAERAHKLLTAANSGPVKIVDLVDFQESVAQPPVEQIAKAVGDRFQVWQVQGRTVAIEGTVPSTADLEDLGKLLATFEPQAKIVNLVRVVQPRPDINETMVALQEILGNKLVVRPLQPDKLIVEGAVATPEELTRLRDIVAKFQTTYQIVDLLHVALPEKKQIICHVRIVDVNKGELQRLGVNWGQLSYNGENVTFIDQPWLIQNMSGLGGPNVNGVQNVLSIGSQIDLLAQNNRARILSQPDLMVDDGGKAEMLVGGEIPVPISQPGGGGVATVTVEWKPYGVKLNMEPCILEDGKKINLKIIPEVSSLDFGNAVTISGFVLPAMRSRRASTEVTMASGDTLLLGGLLQSEDTKALRKIPVLGDLPIIGALFRRKEFTMGQSELVIMVTPEIFEGGAPVPLAPGATAPGK